MPHEWVDPEIAVAHDGLIVYHCYTRHGMVSECWYTTDASNSDTDSDDGSDTQFDVSEIYAAASSLKFEDDAHAIRYAIEAGWLTEDGLRLPDEVARRGQET